VPEENRRKKISLQLVLQELPTKKDSRMLFGFLLPNWDAKSRIIEVTDNEVCTNNPVRSANHWQYCNPKNGIAIFGPLLKFF